MNQTHLENKYLYAYRGNIKDMEHKASHTLNDRAERSPLQLMDVLWREYHETYMRIYEQPAIIRRLVATRARSSGSMDSRVE